MNNLLRNIIGVYSKRQYRLVILLTLVVLSISGVWVWQVVKNHKNDLRKEVYSKSQFVILSIEDKAFINLLIGDYRALQDIEANLQEKDSAILGLSFYSNEGKWLYGNKESILFTTDKWGHTSREGKILTSYKYEKSSRISNNYYIQVAISEKSLQAEVEKLRNNSIGFVLILVVLVNSALFKKFYDLEVSVQKEVELTTEAEISNKKERIQRRFLANMSHELRTPLNAIIGFAKLLSQTTDEAESKEFIKMLTKSSEHMKNLISDILDLSKIQEGKLELDNDVFDLNELYFNVLEILEHRLSDSVYLKNTDSSTGGLFVLGDALRLKQVMMNLVSNAIKYTEKGYINPELNVKLIDDKYKIRFQVADTGLGIPEGKEAHLFDDFYQAHSSSLQIEGSGLGLGISKNIIDLFGGEIGYFPHSHGGSVFYFEIELKKAKAVTQKVTEYVDPDFSTHRVLVAEDNEFNRILVKTLLKKYHFDIIDVAVNGREAVVFAHENEYDLVLMDIQMPIMGGVEALQVIRKDQPELPIIALTANAVKGDSQFFIEKGFTSYISKPIDDQVLIAELQKILTGVDIKNKLVSSPSYVIEGEGDPENIFNAPAMLSNVGGSKELLVKLIGIFSKTIISDLAMMKGAIDNSDMEKVSSLAHHIKPSIIMFFPPFSKDLIATLENVDKTRGAGEIRRAYERLNIDVKLFLKQANIWRSKERGA